jgi:hypothetical protein
MFIGRRTSDYWRLKILQFFNQLPTDRSIDERGGSRWSLPSLTAESFSSFFCGQKSVGGYNRQKKVGGGLKPNKRRIKK